MSRRQENEEATSTPRTLREGRRMTQARLAERAGVTKSYIGQIEKGEWPQAWRGLSRLADVLGVTADSILGRGESPTDPVDALSYRDRKLLDQMRHHAEQLLGPQVLRLAGGWHRIAEMQWLGYLQRLRAYGVERPALPPPQREATESNLRGAERVSAGPIIRARSVRR